MTINTNIDATNVDLTNNTDAKAIVNRATVVFATNDGLVEVKHSAANVTVTAGSGEVDNTIGGKITNTASQTIFATFGAMTNADELKKYDALTKLTALNLTGEWTIDSNTEIESILAASAALETVEVINFNAGSSMTLGNVTLDLTGKAITDININADVEWVGRSAATSIVTATSITITETAKPAPLTGNYTLTKTDITVNQ